MEILSAEVFVATHDAYQNMSALVGSIEGAETALRTLEGAVDRSEKRLDNLAEALKFAEEQFQRTGSAVDRMKMEAIRDALEDTKRRANEMRSALSNAQTEIEFLGNAQERTAAILSAANREMADAAKASKSAAEGQVEFLGRVSKSVTETEEKVRTLNAAWLAASDTFKATGSMEAAANMERYANQLSETETELGNLRRAQATTIDALSKSTEPAEREAANLARAENQVAMAAERTSRVAVEGSANTTAGLKESTAAAGHLEKGVSAVGDAMSAVFSAFAGFQVAKQILDALDDRLEKIVEARRKLGEIEYKAVEGSQAVAQTLGFGQGTAGEERAARLVAEFRQRTGGLDEKGASDLLARAQASGFDVKGGAGTGFDVASTVGLFAKRLNIDPEAAGKLFNILNSAGAKTTDDADRTLAQLEQAFRNIAMANPTQGVNAAIRGTVDRLEQGVPLSQAIGGVAAAAAANPDVRRAASDAERLSRVAIGGGDKQSLALAQAAAAQGRITPGALAQAAAVVGEDPTIKDHADQIHTQNESIARMREAVAAKQETLTRSQREAQDQYVKFSDEQLKFQAQQAEEQKKLTDPKYRRQSAQIAERMAEQSRAFERRANEYGESIADRQSKDNQTRQQIAEENQRIADAQKKITNETSKDVQGRRDKALIEAYNQLPLADKERVLWDATRGMSPQQAEEFIRRAGGTGAVQPLVKQLTGAGREAYERAAGAAGGANVEDFRRNQQLFTTGSVAGRGQTQAAAERAGAESAGGGQMFANDVETLANQDIDILKTQGFGDTGVFRSFYNNVAAPFSSAETNKRRGWATAESDKALRGKRMLLVLRDRLDKFIQTMTPEQYNKYKPRIDQLWQSFSNVRDADEGFAGLGSEFLEKVQTVAREFGAALSDIQADIAKNGDRNIPSLDASGLQLPAQRNDARLGGGSFAPGTADGPRSDAGGAVSGVSAAGGGGVPSARSGPLAAAGGGGTTYNISVGTVVSGGGDILDLPGRLGAADLNLG